MKPSKFNLIIPLEEGEYLVYNTKSKSQVIVDEERKNHLQNFMIKRAKDKYMTILKKLKEMGILVNKKVNEAKVLENIFKKMKFDSSELSTNIIPTFSCDLRCSYCHQEGISSRKKMDKKTTKSLIAWVSKRMDNTRPRVLNVTFSGGEPLMNPDSVKLISKTLAMAAWARKVKMKINIITNGLLLKPEFLYELKEWGLTGIWVTLDGDEKSHDRLRPAKTGKGTYRNIVNNLKKIKGIVPISINGNFDKKSIRRIDMLLDDLVKEDFTSSEIVNVNFQPILSVMSSKKRYSVCDPLTQPSLNPDDHLHLWQEIVKRGFTPGNGINLGPCEVIKENSFTIDPEGRIYKSSVFVGTDKHIIGYLTSKDMSCKNKNKDIISEEFLQKECRRCPFTMICDGYADLQKTLNFKGELKTAPKLEKLDKAA